MNRRKKNNILIGVLCCALVFMGIGYALLNTVLNIGATANITGEFDIRITNVAPVNAKTTSGASNVSTSIENDHVTANVEATFNAPGDYITYLVTVENLGSIDGVISEIATNVNNSQYYDIEALDMTTEETLQTPIDLLVGSNPYQFYVRLTFDKNKIITDQEGLDALKTAVVTTLTVRTAQKRSASVVNNGGGSSQPSQGECVVPNNTLTVVKTVGGTSVCQPLSQYGASNLEQGDLLQYNTEQFYAISLSGNNLKLLARYQFNVGPHQKTTFESGETDTRGLQDPNVGWVRSNVNSAPTSQEVSDLSSEFQSRGYLYGSVSFASGVQYWISGSDIDTSNYPLGTSGYPFVYDSHSNVYQYITGQSGYVNTLSTMGLNATSGSLLSVEEVQDICHYSTNNDYNSCPGYLLEVAAWIGSAYNVNDVWYTAPMEFTHTNAGINMMPGVRPLITVSLSQ